MNLHKLIFTESDCYKEGMAKKQFIKPIALMWHSTGANNPYLKRYVGPDDGLLGKNIYNNHWNQPRDRRVCYHAFVGKLKDDTIASYQVLPWDLRGWHSGSGKNGNGNSLGYIGICICEDNLKDKAYAMAVYQEAVEFSAYICKLYGLDPLGKNRHGLPVVLDHASAHKLGIASNHGDVLHWFGRYGITLDKIRRDVWALLEPELKPPGKVPYTIRLDKGTPYYIQPDNTSKVAGRIDMSGVYTIVEEVGAYGWLKSGAGWVQVKDDPKPEPVPVVPKLVDTWARANTVRQGSKGKHVEVLQALLQMRGYDVQAIDGSFGAVTDRQVRAYQKAQGLTVDGIVGYETWPVILK